MTKVDHLRITDFKAIEQLEVEPQRINVITGRNNSGKTSLLESIDLLFNPQNLVQYEENAPELITAGKKSCSISAEYRKPQTQIPDYSSGDRTNRQRELGLRKPRDIEVINLFHKTLNNILDLNKGYPLSSLHLDQVPIDEDQQPELGEFMREILRTNVSNLSERELLESGAKDNIVILEVDGEKYPFIHLGEYFDQLRERLVKDSIQDLSNRVEFSEITNDLKSDPTVAFSQAYQRLLTPRFGKARFIENTPPELPGVDFIRRVKGDSSQFDLEQENAAVRMNKIENYLRENDLIEGLVDFSFNKIVIQEKNEDPYEVPYEFLGKGVKVIVRVLWALFDEQRKDDILLLEEPENHMHPGYVESVVGQLIDISRKRGMQIFVTTHNLDLINSFFSPQMEGEREEFIENEFQLLQLTQPVPKVMDYKQAAQKTDDLDLDLRGV